MTKITEQEWKEWQLKSTKQALVNMISYIKESKPPTTKEEVLLSMAKNCIILIEKPNPKVL